ncbi:MAG TPA: sigma-54 dependent transcriptional regulator [Candidatus Binatia bacterium]
MTCRLFAEVLENEGYLVDSTHTCEEALERIAQSEYQAIVLDVRMPGMTGLEAARVAHERDARLPIIIMTAFGDIDTAVQAIHDGAFDFISKPMNLDELKSTVARALRQPKIARDGGNGDGGKMLPHPGTLIGTSPAIVDVYKTIAHAAPTASTVLITGESGTGKELIARAIHQHSSKAGGPFVAVDCGALTETLLASELFGHVRGAFTGAVSDKKGVFEEASGGTCFLDEIGDIGPAMQSKLLRVLQEHQVRRVGGQKWTKIDARVIAATNKNLEDLMRQRRYREDLFYRLNVVSIHVPPLRERRQDIPALARYFLDCYGQSNGKAAASISEEAMALLESHDWPGNVRELENTIEQALVLSNRPALTVEDLPAAIRDPQAAKSSQSVERQSFNFPDTPPLEEMKKRYVLHVLDTAGGNISRAAKLLDIDRRSLYRMLARYNVGPYSRSAE